MTTKDEMEAAHEWADQVSKHLDGWMIGGGEGYWPHLNGPNGARVTIYQNSGKRDRYTLRGIYPTDGVPQTSLRYSLRYYNVLRYDEDPQDIITVSAKREPECAAKDIARRLLPRYLDLYERCREKARKLAAERERLGRMARELARIVQGRVGSDKKMPSVYGSNAGDLSFQIFSDENIQIELSHVPFDLALQIARIIGEHNK